MTARRRGRLALAGVAMLFFAAHLPFLAPTLEDIDSINFALGIRDFDIARHQPHPPGYPITIALGKLAAPWMSEPHALAIWSALFGALAVWPLFMLFLALDPSARSHDERSDDLDTRRRSLRAGGALLLTITCPLYWFTASRPMSDVPGLAAALAAQALFATAFVRQGAGRSARGTSNVSFDATRAAESGRLIVAGALVAGLAIGFRVQGAWLTLPLLALVLADRAGRDAAGALLGASVAVTVGMVSWVLPLVIASGGPSAYVRALGAQAVEDFAGVDMLATNPTARRLAFGLLETFVLPWSSQALGGILLGLAVIGGLAMLWRSRRAVLLLAATFVPYAVFHLVFQETLTTRYALPLIPAVAFIAVSAIDLLARRVGAAVVASLAVINLMLAGPALAGYAAAGSPVSRALEEVKPTVPSSPRAIVAMHYAFARAFEAERMSAVTVLPSRPKHEWLELVRYWRGGGDGTVWFLADPRRTDLALVDRQSRHVVHAHQWPFASEAFLGGIRPSEVHLTQIRSPGWFAEEGWALTPETAGVAEQDGRGLTRGPISAFVRRRSAPAALMIGGRNLGAKDGPSARVQVSLDGRPLTEWIVTTAAPFFLRFVPLPAGTLAGEGAYARLDVTSAAEQAGSAASVGIEQFDVQSAGHLMFGFDMGWHEQEFNPTTGRLWRWSSERSTLRVEHGGKDMVLRITGESPLRYFDGPPHVTIKAGESVLLTAEPSADFDYTVKVSAATLERSGNLVTLETDRTFIPADRSGSLDRRHLGLRVYSVEIRPAF